MEARNNDEKELYWREQMLLYGEQKSAGEAFCKLHGLSYCQFLYWRRKLTAITPAKKCVVQTPSFISVALPAQNIGRSQRLPDASWCAEFIVELVQRSQS